MKRIIFLFFIFQFYYVKSAVYSIENIFTILNNLTESEENMTIIRDTLSEALDKIYVYNQIYKNPPQPEFNKNYHIIINIQQKLENIKTKNTSPYEFYRNIKFVLDSLGDQHLGFGGDIILNHLYFLEPIKLNIRYFENKHRVFAEKITYSDYLKYFRNSEEVIEKINKNINTPIISINGKDPFDFITNFGGVFKKLKNPQATFRYKFSNYNGRTLTDYPLSLEDMKNFTVIYENGDEFVTDYIIYTITNLNDTIFIKENKFFDFNLKKDDDDEIIPPKASSFLLFNNLESNILKTTETKFNIKNEKINYDILGSISWDEQIDSSIFCKVEKEKKINVYIVTNLNINENPRYIKTIKNCVELFDNNDYPIVLINIFNQGGLVYDAQLLLELLSPKTTINIYGAFRNNGILDNSSIFNNEILSSFSDSKECEALTKKNIMEKSNKVNYGDNVEDILSDIVIFNGKKLKKEVNSIKRNLKNPRKPTDILVYTDGYTFSSGAIMIKFLQFYGGAITAGYFPNPNLDNTPYDNGQSASALFSYKILENFNIKEYNTLDKFNCYLSVPGAQIFYTPNDLEHPLEYTVSPVDEIVDVYPIYENVYNIIKEDDYNSLLNESLKIFEKYKTSCNPNNQKLLLLTSECDNKFGNNYTHGGYKCGENGLWSKECVASYCDDGYIFDHSKKRCIVDICSDIRPSPEPDSEIDSDTNSDTNPNYDPEKDSSSSGNDSNSKSNLVKIILISLGALIFISIIIIIVIILRKRKNLKKDVDNIDNMNLDEQIIAN